MSFRSLLSFSAVLLLLAGFAAGISKKDLQKLPPNYREWLTRDVAYIITNEEQAAFLQLSTNAERDNFIDRFWEVRNPNPGSPTNTYKEEIYRRIAYANDTFGAKDSGWRTDRGRVYITLGAPKQVGRYYGFANIRPMEIWFYSNGNPALPPFFYVVFYQKDAGGDFRLYSPFMDGPDALVTGGGFENDRVSAWNQIDHDAGREVSRTTLTLLPNEPVDYQTATSSLASDVLLSTIRGLANNPMTKDMLKQRRELLESVSHRVVLGAEYLDVLAVPLVSASGETNLHYVLRLKRPDDFSVAEDTEGRYYYSALVTAKVMTPDDKVIFRQERKLTKYVDAKQYVIIKNRVFGYEGLLPLPPGKYKIEFQLADELKHTSFRSEREVVIPDRPKDQIRITEVVPFAEAASGESSSLPFSIAGVHFTPEMDSLTLAPGRDLQFFYQIWAPADMKVPTDGKMQVEYAYGRMGMHDTHTLTQDIAVNQFDANGALINGKKIETAALPPGEYRMAITLTDPASRTRSVASFRFQIADSHTSPPVWDIPDPDASDEALRGVRDYNRALCYLAESNDPQAIVFLRKAYQKNPDEATRARLVNLLYQQGQYSEVVDLYRGSGVSPQTSEETIIQMAESLNRTGQVAKSIQLLESALPSRQNSAVLYLSLARYYQASGNPQKATEMEQKGKAIASQPTT